MIKGIGTDIIEVGRVERESARLGPDFLQRLFTPGEIDYCESKRRPFESYAARFAAKEAFLKALGTGGRDGISWQDIEVIRDARGRPELVLRGRAEALARERGISKVFVSLSHSHEFATAVTVLEGNGEQVAWDIQREQSKA
jgi:holo-[acyl-carrier protein] synthase